MINYTLNDPTQQMLLPHLKITEELLSRVATKLSGQKKYAEITAMPDLGIAHNCTRMMGGFFTGARYVWDSTVPFVPVDATVNVCGTAVFGSDALNRCSSLTNDLEDYVSDILDICPGKIIGKLHQIVSVSKDGTKIW